MLSALVSRGNWKRRMSAIRLGRAQAAVRYLAAHDRREQP